MDKYQGFVYEWTNKVNNMKYIGAHNGSVDDGYIGGGNKFRIELKKYGLDNFERKILEYVEDSTKLKDRENYYLDLVDAAENEEYYNTSRRSSGSRVKKIPEQKKRGLCTTCHQHPVAVNYIKDNITHYRSRCDNCLRKSRGLKKRTLRWEAAGYKKKMQCDRCGFRARYSSQILVYHVNGNLNDVSHRNLKSVCRNCVEEIAKSGLPWRLGDLEPDTGSIKR